MTQRLPCRSEQIGITNGNTPDGRDHAGATSTSFRDQKFDAAGNSIGGDCAGKHGGNGDCIQRSMSAHEGQQKAANKRRPAQQTKV